MGPGLIFIALLVAIVNSAPTGDNSSIRLVGGTPASPGEFPYFVSIQLHGGEEGTNSINSHLCGGFLVSMSHVITSASCFMSPSPYPERYIVAAGATLLTDILKGHTQARRVKTITQYPGYYYLSNHRDIAVMELTEPFEPSPVVATIPLASRQQVTYPETCLIAGLGSVDSTQGNRSSTLMKGSVQIHPSAECSRMHGAVGSSFNATYEFCANGINEKGQNVDACHGDKGGPLVCAQDDGTLYVAGVTAYRRITCTVKEIPGIYMEVSKYRTWIDTVLAGTSQDDGTHTTSLPNSTAKPQSIKQNNNGLQDGC